VPRRVEIFQKEYHRQKKGQANKGLCSVLQNQKMEGDCFGALIVKLSCVIKKVSKQSFLIDTTARYDLWSALHLSIKSPLIHSSSSS
jgi:hypothetical protein